MHSHLHQRMLGAMGLGTILAVGGGATPVPEDAPAVSGETQRMRGIRLDGPFALIDHCGRP
jgi:hypothetical protein